METPAGQWFDANRRFWRIAVRLAFGGGVNLAEEVSPARGAGGRVLIDDPVMTATCPIEEMTRLLLKI